MWLHQCCLLGRIGIQLSIDGIVRTANPPNSKRLWVFDTIVTDFIGWRKDPVSIFSFRLSRRKICPLGPYLDLFYLGSTDIDLGWLTCQYGMERSALRLGIVTVHDQGRKCGRMGKSVQSRSRLVASSATDLYSARS